MTLFDVSTAPVIRSSSPLPRGEKPPTWTKYSPKTPQRCDECVLVAFESSPGSYPGIANARWSRRQDGATRLFCNGHGNAQKAEDALTYTKGKR